MNYTKFSGNYSKSHKVIKTMNTMRSHAISVMPDVSLISEINTITHCRAFGEIKTLRLPKKLQPGAEQHRGFAFVDYHSKTDAKVHTNETFSILSKFLVKRV